MHLSLPELEMELISLLAAQGLPVQEIRLIGLLGKGSRATVFSVMVDGVYHVLKLYDSKESLKAELKNFKKVMPRDRLLFWWQDQVESGPLNLAIIEVPEGRELTADRLTAEACGKIGDRLVALHGLRYRQRVSVSALRDTLKRARQPFEQMVLETGRPLESYTKLFKKLDQELTSNAELYRVRKSRVHGDLWWPNIIAAQEDIYFIDWESIHRADPAEDLAKLRRSWYFPRDPELRFYFWASYDHALRARDCFQEAVGRYAGRLGDQSLIQRLAYYMPAGCIVSLADRYLSGMNKTELDCELNGIIADEILALREDPLSIPSARRLERYFGLLASLAATSADPK